MFGSVEEEEIEKLVKKMLTMFLIGVTMGIIKAYI
jgi:hypothetical protein